MKRIRVKICGITRAEDALLAADSGADALGFVFYSKSPRAINAEQAKLIAQQLPAFVSKVGLFVNAEQQDVEQISEAVGLDYLQFHGDETATYCAAFSRSYIKALRVKPGMNLTQEIAPYQSASAVLLDTWHPQQAGGTGEAFDWSLLDSLDKEDKQMPPVILAGGLHAGNVRSAILQVQPYAVDVSSGVEASPGIKSAGKIREFINEVNGVGYAV